jgi:hypothetical protein
MAEARAHAAAGRRVGVLFGPERAGLESADVARADAIVSVPVNPEFPSLNLAQCVLLMAYEWRRDRAAAPQAHARGPRGRPRHGAERGRTAGRSLRGEARRAGFFFPPDKAAHMKLNLRNMLGRLELTRGDVQLFTGCCASSWRVRAGRGEWLSEGRNGAALNWPGASPVKGSGPCRASAASSRRSAGQAPQAPQGGLIEGRRGGARRAIRLWLMVLFALVVVMIAWAG